jgi:putative glycosyltransferase (TIGR04372 family)
MIGTSSGMSHIPLMFNKKILYTNWMPFGEYFHSRKTMTITKKIKNKRGEYVDFQESNKRFIGVFNQKFFDIYDLVVEDNTESEILQATIDIIKFQPDEENQRGLKVRIAPSFKNHNIFRN